MTLPRQKLEIGQCNCFAIRKAARRITRLYDNFLQPTGLRITQFLILATLVEVGSNSVNGLRSVSIWNAPRWARRSHRLNATV